MTELDLTFTEQVFLQETGLNSKEENVNATKLSINDLLDTYDRLERPVRRRNSSQHHMPNGLTLLQISQIDGVDDDEVSLSLIVISHIIQWLPSTPTPSAMLRSFT